MNNSDSRHWAALASVLIAASLAMLWQYGALKEEEEMLLKVVKVNIVKMDMENKTQNLIILKTNLGDIKLELFSDDAPKTVENFLKLSKSGFYDGTKFHRVIKDFMIQGGDPNSKDDDWSTHGIGGPGYAFADEFNEHKVVRGALAMANSGPNTNGSQFFIVTADTAPWLDGKHTVFGEVVDGMDVVLKIENLPANQNDHPLQDATIESIEIIE